MSVNFSCALFSFLDFLAFEDGAYRLSQSVGKEECRSHMTIWPCRLRFELWINVQNGYKELGKKAISILICLQQLICASLGFQQLLLSTANFDQK